MYKKYFIVLFTHLTIVGFSGCSEEYEMISETEMRMPVSFTLAERNGNEDKLDTKSVVYTSDDEDMTVEIIEDGEWQWRVSPETKTSWPAGPNGSNSVTWVQGDEIGIYKRLASGVPDNNEDQSNVRYRVTSSTKESDIEPVNGVIYYPKTTSEARFLAYYPYSESAGNNTHVSYTLPSVQTNPSELAKADIMYAASSLANSPGQSVPLHFNHKMSLLSIRVNTTPTSGRPIQLESITLNGPKVTNKGTLNLIDGSVNVDPTSLFKPKSVVNKGIHTNLYAYADFIINPCTVHNTQGSSNINVTNEEFYVTFIFTLPVWTYNKKVIKGTFTFEPGKRYMLNVTI